MALAGSPPGVAVADIFVIHPDGRTSADRIPGECDPTTLTHRQPGAIGGRPNGGDIPSRPPDWEDDVTRHEHELEGGGAPRERRSEAE